MAVEDNSQFVQQREREVNQIVRSIHDLNEIFKDLATMIVDQVSQSIKQYINQKINDL